MIVKYTRHRINDDGYPLIQFKQKIIYVKYLKSISTNTLNYSFPMNFLMLILIFYWCTYRYNDI